MEERGGALGKAQAILYGRNHRIWEAQIPTKIRGQMRQATARSSVVETDFADEVMTLRRSPELRLAQSSRTWAVSGR